MNGPSEFDVVVAGGGPAGAALAALLSGAGHAVVVCDAARFPRHKICGEYVPPAALPLLSSLGVLRDLETFAPRRHVGMAVVSPDGTKVLGRYAQGQRGLALRRYDFDHVLLEGARRRGAAVREGTRIVGLSRLPRGGFAVDTRSSPGGAPGRLRARVLVGADGRNSFVARWLGVRRPEPRHRRWAVMGHFTGVEAPDDHGEMIVAPGGYCGINPLPGGLANVCVVVERGALRRAAPGKAGLRAFLLGRVASHPLTRARMAGAVLRDGPWAAGPMACRAARAVDDDVILAGDAAGFYDPFTGEGIGMALRGAEIGAEILSRALRRGRTDREALRLYEAARRAAFADRLRLDRILQAVLGRPRLADWVARRLRRRPDLADLLARVAGDTLEAGRILRPAFMARLLLA